MDATETTIAARLADGNELHLVETLERRGQGSAQTDPYAIVTYSVEVASKPWRWAIQIGSRATATRTDDELRELARAKLRDWLSEAELRPNGLWHRRYEEFV